METIKEFLNIDFVSFIYIFFLIMAAIIAIKKIIEEFSKIIKKPVWWIGKNNQDHELLLATVAEFKEFKANGCQNDMNVSEYINEINGKLDSIVNDISNVADAVIELKSNDKKQNQALVESMRDRMQQRCRYFTNVLHGIPENELASLVDYLKAYEGVNGNHGLQTEVQKCIDTLPILPVTIIKTLEEQKN